MNIENILAGMLIGAAMSIPFGPIGAICLQRIIWRGKVAGLASGLGVALGDTMFAAFAILGVTQVAEVLLQHQHLLELIGGMLIMIHGIRNCMHSAPAFVVVAENRKLNAFKDISSMFLITVANPQTILGFSAALVGMVKFYHLETTQDSVLLLGGVFAGSMLWWLVLSTMLDAWRSKLSENFTQKLHRYAAVLVAVMGAGLVLHAAKSFV